MRQWDGNMDENLIIEILKVFKKYDYKIYIKNHPTYSGNITYNLSKLFNIQMIDNKLYDATSIMKEKKPRYIVSWFGTAICESLSSDIIPITLGKQFGYDGRYGRSKKNISQDFNKDPEMVYPIFKRSINWHKEQKIIYDLLDCKITYLSILSKLKLR